MKKKCCILLIILILLSGCRNKEVTLDSFTSKATYNGYIVKRDKSGYENYQSISNVYYAINRENAYNIQFLELNSEEYAHNFFLLNKNDLKDNVNKDDYEKTKSMKNYELYHAETMSTYYLVVRSYKNIIYIKAPINFINEIEEFLTDLDLDY